MYNEGVYTRNEVQNENKEINEICGINEVATPNLHSTIDDLIGHHVLSTLGNSQDWQLSVRLFLFTSPLNLFGFFIFFRLIDTLMVSLTLLTDP